jgi:hypothetical protein
VPSYFFRTNHPAERSLQADEGLDFASIHEAKGQAGVYAGQLLCDAKEHFWDSADFELTVTDENGLILFAMRVMGTVAPAIRTPPLQGA